MNELHGKVKNAVECLLLSSLLCCGVVLAVSHVPVLQVAVNAAETPAGATVELTVPAVAEEEQQLQADIEYLASEELEGRDTGSEGIQLAAEYIQQVFADAGWSTPATLPSGRQNFSIPGVPQLGTENSLVLSSEENPPQWKLKDDYTPCAFGGAGIFSAPVVFCGYGIIDPENQFDEFAGVDLQGKIALMIRRVPGQTKPGSLYVKPNGTVDVNRAALRTKLVNAQKKGAVAVLLVNDPFSTKAEADELLPFGYGGVSDGKQIPAFHISQKTADELLQAGTGKSLQDFEAMIEETLRPASVELKDVMLTGQADLTFEKTIGQNLIAVLEPADPDNAETVIVGAHYDHVGWGTYGSLAPGIRGIHHGADDNASGTTAVLGLARRLAGLSGKLPRRIVLICFAAEERGLLGSKHYVAEPIYPLEETVAMINLDMNGNKTNQKKTKIKNK